MPISPERKKLYPPNWREISIHIRERDGNRCKVCGVPNGVYIIRSTVDPERWCMDDPVTSGCLTFDGHLYKWSEAPDEYLLGDKLIKVVLTVAHLNHDETDCRDENLAALCQLHHLRLDARSHADHAKQTLAAKHKQALESAGQQELL